MVKKFLSMLFVVLSIMIFSSSLGFSQANPTYPLANISGYQLFANMGYIIDLRRLAGRTDEGYPVFSTLIPAEPLIQSNQFANTVFCSDPTGSKVIWIVLFFHENGDKNAMATIITSIIRALNENLFVNNQSHIEQAISDLLYSSRTEFEVNVTSETMDRHYIFTKEITNGGRVLTFRISAATKSENQTKALEHFNQGIDYGKSDQYEQAIQEYYKAIQFNPNYDKAYNNRGVVYGDLGKYERAIQDFDRAIQLNPNDAIYYSNRGEAYCYLGQYERAIQDCNKAIQINPKFYYAYYNRGWAYAKMEQYERAIKDFEKTIQLKFNNAEYYERRGNVYEKLKQYKQAIKDYKKAIQLNPDDQSFRENMMNRISELSKEK